MPLADYEAHKAYMRKRYWTVTRLSEEALARKLHRQDVRQKARQKFLNRTKRRSGCVDCGWNGNVDGLQFDHVRGEKHKTVGGLSGGRWSLLLAEVAKCDVRCATCHAIKTARGRREGTEKAGGRPRVVIANA